MRSIFEDRFLFEEGVYWAYTTDDKRNIDRKDSQILPEEIVERVSSGMNLCNHLVYVIAELVYSDFLLRRYEYAWCLFLRYPAVFKFIQATVVLSLRLQRKLVIFFVSVRIDLVEYDINRLVVWAVF